MITPSRIAVAGSCAMAVSVVVTNGIVQLAGPASPSVSLAEWLASTAAGALGIGFLVWVGMYLGARFSPPPSEEWTACMARCDRLRCARSFAVSANRDARDQTGHAFRW
jgi:hypothetical protein